MEVNDRFNLLCLMLKVFNFVSSSLNNNKISSLLNKFLKRFFHHQLHWSEISWTYGFWISFESGRLLWWNLVSCFYKNLYTLSVKLHFQAFILSFLNELMTFDFLTEHNYKVYKSRHQMRQQTRILTWLVVVVSNVTTHLILNLKTES